jgi:hypothetical protein
MIRTIPTLVLLLIAPAATAAGPLERNPFRVPVELVRPAAEQARSQPDGGPETLDLRATLVAGRRSSVSLGGWILSLGEEISGYRLVSVREGEAVFSKDGETVQVSIHQAVEQPDGRDEE